MDALIVGGGIGGLSAALGLREAGARVTLFERAPRIEQVGAGIGLAPNAQRALEFLGVSSAVGQFGNVAATVMHCTSNGKLLATRRNETLWVHRADLQKVLLEAMNPGSVELGCTFGKYEQHPNGVVAHFANGLTAEGDVLVGADGLRSAVRGRLLGDHPPRHTGSIAWRGVAHFPQHGADRNLEVWGRGARFGLFSIGRGKVYWVAGRRAHEGFVLRAGERRERLLAMYQDWMAPIQEAISATPEDSIIQTDMYDRRPVRRWQKGRVALLGDAAHPMTADMGQGCAQVLEDAVVLSRCARADTDPVAMLAAYVHGRMKRANSVLRGSHRYNRLAFLNSGVACTIRNAVLLDHMGRTCGKQADAGTQMIVGGSSARVDRGS